MKNLNGFAIGMIVSLMLSAGCSPVAPSPEAPAPPTPSSVVPQIVTLSAAPTDTPLAGPFVLNLTPLPSATALPTLVLPPSPSVPLDLKVWDGLPTYPAESQPDFYFRLRYDPASWALVTDQFGHAVLASRALPGCLIGAAGGRGLPPTGSVDHDVRQLDEITYQVSRVSLGGRLQSVNYAGGDARIFTSFVVSFQDQSDPCIQSAEMVLGTLRSVPLDEATPVIP